MIPYFETKISSDPVTVFIILEQAHLLHYQNLQNEQQDLRESTIKLFANFVILGCK